jgi:hypothetical protein
MIFCKFVYLCASQQNHSLNKLPQRISLAKLFDVTLNSGYLLRDKSQHSLEVEAISYIQDGSQINVKHMLGVSQPSYAVDNVQMYVSLSHYGCSLWPIFLK